MLIAQACAATPIWPCPTPKAGPGAARSAAQRCSRPALLGRIVTIPYYPLSDEMLGAIIRLQLGRIVKRVAANHEAESSSMARTWSSWWPRAAPRWRAAAG